MLNKNTYLVNKNTHYLRVKIYREKTCINTNRIFSSFVFFAETNNNETNF